MIFMKDTCYVNVEKYFLIFTKHNASIMMQGKELKVTIVSGARNVTAVAEIRLSRILPRKQSPL